MELVKKLLELIISFFKRDVAKAESQQTLADAKEELAVKTIEAESSKEAMEAINTANNALAESQRKHEEDKKSNVDDSNQFGSDW